MDDARAERLVRAAMEFAGASDRTAEDDLPSEAGAETETTGENGDALPSFPEIAWRGPFADYRAAMEGTTEASDVAHFATLWAGISVTLARRVRMYAGEDLYPNVYLAIFGLSGDKKTTAMRRLIKLSLLDPEIRVIRNIGSTEGLADALAQDGGGTALFYWEELAAFLAQARWKGSTILEFLTEAFDCPPRWGREYRTKRIEVNMPTLSILTGTTPEWFWKNALPQDFYGGFGNRFLYLTGRRKAPIAEPSEPSGAVLERVRDRLKELRSIPPVVAHFASDARRIWKRFYDEQEGMHREGLLGVTLKRVHIYVRKLAMVYAAVEGTLPVINGDQLSAAMAVGVYAEQCAAELIEHQGSCRPRGELENVVLQWVRRHPGEKKRHMHHCLAKKAGGCAVLNQIVRDLIVAGFIEERNGRLYATN